MTVSFIEQQRRLLKDLAALATEVAAAERQIEADFASRQQAVERDFQQARQQASAQYTTEREAAETEFAETRARMTQEYDAAHLTMQEQIKARLGNITEQYNTDKQQGKSACEEACWTIEAVCEAAVNHTEAQWRDAQDQVSKQREALRAFRERADRTAADWIARDDEEQAPPAPGNTDAADCIAEAEADAGPSLSQ